MNKSAFKRGRVHSFPGDIPRGTRIKLLEKGHSKLAKALRRDDRQIIDRKFRRSGKAL